MNIDNIQIYELNNITRIIIIKVFLYADLIYKVTDEITKKKKYRIIKNCIFSLTLLKI